MKKMVLLSILVLMGLVFLASCGKPNENQAWLIGRWKAVDHAEVIEFLRDGKFTSQGTGAGFVTGKYTFIDNERIRIQIAGRKANVVKISFPEAGYLDVFFDPNEPQSKQTYRRL